jgi:uncharacterized repeat protein (TIGR02543 family)
MNRNEKRYKSIPLLIASLLLLLWSSPVSADPTPPPQPEETNLEGATILDEPALQATTTETAAVDETLNFEIANQLPSITIWYENSLQFGQLGNPQERVDILGNVSDPDGSIRSLTYQLNGGSIISTSVGPDSRRLARRGDFVVALPISSLRSGSNSVVITATDNSGGVRSKTVSFNYTANRVWPMPYSVRWGSAGSIHNVAQVVDGLWNITSNGVRISQVGYDRVIAIGDVNWTDYEVLVPITIHSFTPDPNNTNDAGGVGIITRWQGHIGSSNPPDGWTRLGAYGYYSNRLKTLALRMNETVVHTQSFNFNFGRTYMFKMRAETVSGGGRYSLKVWEQGKPEPSWNDSAFSSIVNRVDTDNDLVRGSVLLVAHRADATFGDVTICPLNATYNLNVSVNGSGRVDKQPNKTTYQCAEGVTLTAVPASGWAFTGWTGDITSTANPLSFNMTKAHNITANFRQVQTQPLNHKTFLPLVNR